MKYRLMQIDYVPLLRKWQFYILNESKFGMLTSLMQTRTRLQSFIKMASEYEDNLNVWHRYECKATDRCIAEADTLYDLIRQVPWIFL